jgi:hypothetical protein
MTDLPQVYRNYELLFTPHLIIDQLAPLPETHPDALAFALMMIKLGGCLPCEMDSYRAQRGCATCARQTVLSYKGNDTQLIQRYENARKWINKQLAKTELEQAA